MQTQTIKSIKQRIDEVDKSLRTFVVREHAKTNFGAEQEYTAKSLKSSLKSILGDLRGLTKAHSKFVGISTYEERCIINNHLFNINRHLTDKDYISVASVLDQLRLIVRPYNLRVLPESGDDITERMNKLHDLHTQSEDKLEEVERICEKMELARKNIEKAEEHLNVFSQSLAKLEDKSNQTDNLQQESYEHYNQIHELLTQSKSDEGVIKSFAEQIQERTSQLEEQKEKTNKYESQLTKYKEEREEIIEEAEKLISDARSALSYTTASGISAAFTERYNEEKDKSKRNLWWLVMAGMFITIAGMIGIGFLNEEGDSVARIAIMSVVISAAWFSATQYVRHKNILDDYGYKVILAKSIVAFLDQFKEGEERSYYLKTVLREIHQDPLRKKHDVDTPASKLFDMFGKKENK